MGRNVAPAQHNDAPAEDCNILLQGVRPVTGNPVGYKHRRGPVKLAQDLTIKTMLLQGTPQRKIAAALGISASGVQRVRDLMRAEVPAEDLKSGLLSPLRDENAGKLIDHFIGKGLEMKEIKGSDALGAVKLYADRRWPAQQVAPPGPRISFVQINVDVARADLHLGAHPTPTGGVSGDGKTIKGEIINEISTGDVP